MRNPDYYYLPIRTDQHTRGLIRRLADQYTRADGRRCPMWLAVHRAVERDMLRMTKVRGPSHDARR